MCLLVGVVVSSELYRRMSFAVDGHYYGINDLAVHNSFHMKRRSGVHIKASAPLSAEILCVS
jgi:hypothetical protein